MDFLHLARAISGSLNRNEPDTASSPAQCRRLWDRPMAGRWRRLETPVFSFAARPAVLSLGF